MLPLTSGMLTAKVVLLPFVNVKFLVLLSNDAVYNAKEEELSKMSNLLSKLCENGIKLTFCISVALPDKIIVPPFKLLKTICPFGVVFLKVILSYQKPKK